MELFFAGFGQFYDIVIDMDAASPLQIQDARSGGRRRMTFLPNALSVRGTLQRMEGFISQKFSFDNFLFVLNQVGLPQGLDEESISHTIERFGKHVELALAFRHGDSAPHQPKAGRPWWMHGGPASRSRLQL